jgi:TetR/AcrR family transcriptional regulator
MDNRTLILNCALELFALHGYEAVGVQEISEKAGVTKPTLYHYFGSKHGLLRALLETYEAPFTECIRKAAVYEGWLPHTLDHLTRAYFEYARQNPVFYRMQLAMVFAPRDSEANQVISGWNEDQHRIVENVFVQAVKENGNMKGRHSLYAATFIGMLNTCIGLWLNGYLALDDEVTRRVTHQFQHGIYS